MVRLQAGHIGGSVISILPGQLRLKPGIIVDRSYAQLTLCISSTVDVCPALGIHPNACH